MSSAIESQRPKDHEPHTVTVTVNGKPVVVPAPKTTGLAVKEAAVAANLPVTLDFVLSKEKPDGDTEIVGDTDTITVNKNSKFVLIHPDDNS